MQFKRKEWKKSMETLTIFIENKLWKPVELAQCKCDDVDYLHAKLVLNKGNACSERKICCQMFKLFSPTYPLLLLPNLFDSTSSVFNTRTTSYNRISNLPYISAVAHPIAMAFRSELMELKGMCSFCVEPVNSVWQVWPGPRDDHVV
jgi:hypothetical protein